MPYFLFAGQQYYPKGGAFDFRGTFETFEAADAQGKFLTAADGDEDWYQVVNGTEPWSLESIKYQNLGGTKITLEHLRKYPDRKTDFLEVSWCTKTP